LVHQVHFRARAERKVKNRAGHRVGLDHFVDRRQQPVQASPVRADTAALAARSPSLPRHDPPEQRIRPALAPATKSHLLKP